MTRPPTTAALRMPTGLDRGARKALLRPLADAGVEPAKLVDVFLGRGAYGDLDDYISAVAEVWGAEAAGGIARTRTRTVNDLYGQRDSGVDPAAFLLTIPEPDFLTAVEAGVAYARNPFQAAALPNRLTTISSQRGVPYRMEGVGPTARFVWTGDAIISEQVIAPALAAIDDPRFANGPRVEFAAALAELRAGTPQARKQAVAEACNAVESAMKVLLEEREIAPSQRQGAQGLLDALSARGAPIPKEAEAIVLGASRFGNKRGRHGAGPVAHDVDPDEAAAVVSSAATALTFLAARLP